MAELLRFRCPECSKLLGVPPRKAGRVVHCPQCKAELLVPTADDGEPQGGSDDSGEAVGFETLGIDLGFASPLATRPADLPPPRSPDADEVLSFLERAAVAPPAPAPTFELPDEEADEPEARTQADGESAPDPLVTPVEPLVPAAARRRRRRPHLEAAVDRRRDVVIPRTAAISWALFALLALATSFVAGLMIGHYRWK